MPTLVKSDIQSEPLKAFRQALESKGLKLTKQRAEILDYLLKAKKHMAPEAIYRELNKRDSSLGRATVFRTLRVLEDAGLADKILLADGKSAYEHKFAKPHHDHMICVDCSEVIEFSNDTIEKIQNRIARSFGFSQLWHRHEIFGKCRKCQD